MKRIFFLWLVFVSYTLGAATFVAHDGLTTSKQWVNGLTSIAECVTKNEAFLKEIGQFPKYDYTTKTPAQVESALRSDKSKMELSTYQAPFWSKAIAYRNIGDNTIYFNRRKNPRQYAEMINTVIHEWLHVAGFDHGNNYATGKQNSVNYHGGLIAEKYVGVCNGN
jgi:hypothetical protein